MGVIEVADGVRKPERLLGLMEAAQIVMAVDTKVWRRRLEVVLGVDAGAIARAVGDPREIGQAVRLVRQGVGG